MIIGVPKEIKNNENRVGLTPAGVSDIIRAGHEVYMELGAGLGSNYKDTEYEKAGASILNTAKEVWEKSDMIIKVKEPQKSEYPFFREDLILFTYLHLANEPELTKALVESKIKAIAYETIEADGALPLLAPMSIVAGKMATQIGAHYLEAHQGGKGIILSSVPGVRKGKVTIIGGGVVGTAAAKMALGLGAQVNILDLNPTRLKELDNLFEGNVQTLMSNAYNIADAVKESDIVIGSVLIPGKKAPTLVTEEMIKSMEPGSVVVDVAIDQGGNFATISEPTTHDNPITVVHDVIHYAVANIPGAAPRTATQALSNATVPYAIQIASSSLKDALHNNEGISSGANVLGGKVTNKAVAEDLGYDYVEPEDAL
ncbi:alanine dehydrogenase [Lacticigenium naphthae]|uniref:alanine dehydrogenase n=1 Tax=Lacticigenium naphthae TaxID=515351 RepID=UPI0003FFA630|nr:alanine dehydrogenase [Lacticigenium naphthae]